MAIKRKRSMKVLNQSGYCYSSVPAIVLNGKWLASAGFAIGDYVTVSCEDGRLVITPDAEKAALVKAEAEFMEREMKSLQKKFEEEKEKLHLQFVAERKAEYCVAEGCDDMGKIMMIGAMKGGVNFPPSFFGSALFKISRKSLWRLQRQ